MRPGELRIGNYFQWSEFASMGKGIDQITHGQQIMDYIELKEGVAITEEWLLKFGFTEILEDFIVDGFENQYEEHRIFSQTGKGWDGFNVHFVKSSYGNIYEFGIVARNDGDILRNVDHVHQLQNLYFALTGKELIIK